MWSFIPNRISGPWEHSLSIKAINSTWELSITTDDFQKIYLMERGLKRTGGTKGLYLWGCSDSAAAAAKSLQLCLTLCDPTDGSPPGSSVHGILQARILEWDAISFSPDLTLDTAWCSWFLNVYHLSLGRNSSSETATFQRQRKSTLGRRKLMAEPLGKISIYST